MFWFFASWFFTLIFSESLEFEFSSVELGFPGFGWTKFQFIILEKLVIVLSNSVNCDLSKTDSRSLFGMRSSENVSC